MFKKKMDKFKKCESGAVTADWVVLSGLVMMVALVVTPAFVSELQAGGIIISDKVATASTALTE